MDIYVKLFEVLFPVFFIVGIGYFLGKKNPKLDTSFITNFAANIGTPAMVFYSITTTGITFEIFTSYFWYALLAISGFALTGIVFLFVLILGYRAAQLPESTRSWHRWPEPDPA